jgi:hypothetical protein
VEDSSTRASKLPYNGYSDEFLDRLEPNGNIPTDKEVRYGKLLSALALEFSYRFIGRRTPANFILRARNGCILKKSKAVPLHAMKALG